MRTRPARRLLLALCAACAAQLIGASVFAATPSPASGARARPGPSNTPAPATPGIISSSPSSKRLGPAAADNEGRIYVLDGWGGVHAAGSAPAVTGGPYWPQWDIARGIAVLPDGSGGYVLDGWGGVHAFSISGQPAPAAPAGGAYWQGWDIARAIALAPWATASTPDGWVLDGWGGVHPFGSAPSVGATAYWPNWDIARGLVILPDSTATSVKGYTLDGWGGVHPFGGAPSVGATAYWPNWDIARGIALAPWATSAAPSGWTLDGWGGVHAFGGAQAVGGSAYWPNWDIARGITLWSSSTSTQPGGWTLDGWGALHPFGGAPSLSGAYWPGWDIARGAGAPGSGSGYHPRQPPPVYHVISNVTYYHQVYELSCEEAALEMALSHENIWPDQTQELNDIGIDWRQAYYDSHGVLHWGDPYTNFVGDPNGSEVALTGYGTYQTTIARVARGYGGRVIADGESVSPQQIYNSVLLDHPAVVWVAFDWRFHPRGSWLAFDGQWVQYEGPVEHAVTVVGVSDTSVYVYNPWFGPQWVSRATFEAAYATYNDMAVIFD